MTDKFCNRIIVSVDSVMEGALEQAAEGSETE
jgi:hypothetical protein